MTATHLERYVLRSPKAGTYFRVNEQDQRIENVTSPDSAWAFHSHEGAVTHARWMGQVMDETPDVVMLRRDQSSSSTSVFTLQSLRG
jgi:hypothetical protein